MYTSQLLWHELSDVYRLPQTFSIFQRISILLSPFSCCRCIRLLFIYYYILMSTTTLCCAKTTMGHKFTCAGGKPQKTFLPPILPSYATTLQSPSWPWSWPQSNVFSMNHWVKREWNFFTMNTVGKLWSKVWTMRD